MFKNQEIPIKEEAMDDEQKSLSRGRIYASSLDIQHDKGERKLKA